ncbi:DUF952 domain-containing protein [Hyphomonas johnsonii]|uniref:Glutathione S-transferase domain-containing protein n=1 Tax=Hyphomonas johnsonii MHS-2 TaxID=1280950 RepID=A0A059FNJ6_9PROT|nr:DUF952 domain-containing protein [Hyphomonas johnsonii]KCZ92081.1 hypothetical protein HJO_08604 [Hyphomonas johnsonii MHS-2]
MTDTHVYKLLTVADWAAAEAAGVTATALDLADGYVHLSARDSVAETARLHYAGASGVRLLEFAIADLPPLKWEPSRGGTLFPHLYHPLAIALATRLWQLDLDSGGTPQMPEDL